jgi:hypothetical protein
MSDATELKISTQRSVVVVLVVVFVVVFVVVEVTWVSFACLVSPLRRRATAPLTDEFADAAVSYAMRCVR